MNTYSETTEQTADSPVCSTCQGAGWYTLPVSFGHPDFGSLKECSMCGYAAEQRRVYQETRQEERTNAALAELRRSLGRLAACTFANFNAARAVQDFEAEGPDGRMHMITSVAQLKRLREALVTALQYAQNPGGLWLFLYGTPGGGKSHLAAAIANAMAEQGIAVACESVPDLLGFIKAGFESNAGEERIQALCDAELLVLDDIGLENYEKPWTLETMFRILNSRSKHNRATVFTSNHHADRLPFRLSSRIAELSTFVWMPISDIRRLPR